MVIWPGTLDESGVLGKRVLRMSGEQIATPDLKGDDRSAAPSQASCCSISATESPVPIAVTTKVLPSMKADTSVPSGNFADKSMSESLLQWK